MSTKQKILAAGLKLFNANGAEIVTTRHIAADIGISQGNLHYHYPNKEKVIEALYEELLQHLKEAESYSAEDVFGPEEVLASMRMNYDWMFQYRFLFRDREIVWRRVDGLKSRMLELFQRYYQRIQQLTRHYVQEGIIRMEISGEQLDFLSNQFVFTFISWLGSIEYIAGSESSEDVVESVVEYSFRLWFPYLKPLEMLKWEKLILK